jgi:hypothetical protein
MKVNVDISKQVFSKDEFYNTVDTNFTQLVPQVPNVIFDVNLATLEDFFILYEKFFFEIPKEGNINSHRFLIQESGDYVGFDTNNEEIQALLEEINSLREENLSLIQDIDNLTKELTKIINEKP